MSEPTVKPCSKCREVLPLSGFNRLAASRDGHKPYCRACQASDYHANRDRELARMKARYVEKKPEYLAASKARHEARRPQELQRMRDAYWADIERNREAKREHYKSNKATYVARARGRKAKVRRATPPWVDHGLIAQVYALAQFMRDITGCDYHVDRIVPLKGDHVCGLHVHTNLEVLPAEKNRSKSNRFGEIA